MEQVKFIEMKHGDAEDYEILGAADREFASHTGERIFSLLEGLESSFGGFKISRLAHSIQSGTRAWRDGADIDWVVSALLHDIGDLHAPYNHGQYAAVVLEPFVREQCSWTVEVHADFQKYYYAHLVGGDRNVREKYKGHACYDDCVDFCELWDQNCFDPEYDDLPLEFFRPLVMEVFSREAFHPDVIKPGVREPLVNAAVAASRTEAA